MCPCLPTWAFVPGVSHPPISQLPIYTSPTRRWQFNIHLNRHPGNKTTPCYRFNGDHADSTLCLSFRSAAHLGTVATSSRSRDDVPEWPYDPVMEADTQLIDEELLRVGIMASLQDAPEVTTDKVEVSKSSVSSIRFVFILTCYYDVAEKDIYPCMSCYLRLIRLL